MLSQNQQYIESLKVGENVEGQRQLEGGRLRPTSFPGSLI